MHFLFVCFCFVLFVFLFFCFVSVHVCVLCVLSTYVLCVFAPHLLPLFNFCVPLRWKIICMHII